MPPTTTQQMGEVHETYLAEITQGTKTKASGSQWTDQGDTRNHHDLPFALRLDGKSTRGKSISVTLDMIAKIREQAHGERPGLGLRWYGSDDLRVVLEDWVAIPGADFEEMLIAARQLKELEAAGVTPELTRILEAAELARDEALSLAGKTEGRLEALRAELAQATAALEEAVAVIGRRDNTIDFLGRVIGRRDNTIDFLGRALQGVSSTDPGAVAEAAARQVPGYVPALPWTVVHVAHRAHAESDVAMIQYGADGSQSLLRARDVRVERTARNAPRIMVDDVLRRPCDVYMDGILVARSFPGQPDAEVG